MEAIQFSGWLKAQLEERRMSGGDLAQRARLARSGIYHFLSGARVPDEAGLKKIAEALEIAFETLPKFAKKQSGRPAK